MYRIFLGHFILKAFILYRVALDSSVLETDIEIYVCKKHILIFSNSICPVINSVETIYM